MTHREHAASPRISTLTAALSLALLPATGCGGPTETAGGAASSGAAEAGAGGSGGHTAGGHGGQNAHGGSSATGATFTIEMAAIPGGTFEMGSTLADNEQPVHPVTLSAYSMATLEITVAQFRAVMGHDPGMFPGDDLPVGHVSFYDAITFANELSEKVGLTPAYEIKADSPVPDTPVIVWNKGASGFRLPTEAEWEFAARGGTTTDTYGGDLSVAGFVCAADGALEEIAWYCSNSADGGQPVGQKKANAYGLHDMLGNVWEWVWDWEPTFTPSAYDPGAVTDPTGKVGSGTGAHVLRGGSWFWPPLQSRSAARIAHVVNAIYSHVDFGFRLAGPAALAGEHTFTFEPHEMPPAPEITADNVPPEMVEVPGGTFEMGPDPGAKRTVTVSPFLVSKTEITQGQYVAVMGENPSHFPGADLPVHGINWYDIAAFANELSLRDGLEPAYDIRTDVEDRPGAAPDPEKVTWIAGANGYRMLTEAEWEYAARGGTTTSLPTGDRTLSPSMCGPDSALEEAGWYCFNAGGQPHPVGQKAANAYGLHDMIGNVTEWVWDWFAPVTGDGLVDPAGPASPSGGRFRVIRGGSWVGAPALHWSGARAPHIVNQYYGHHDFGIRLARSKP